MTYNLVFLKFNNYYNRRIKRYETISEYQDAYEWYSETVTRNIDYNDGINISIVVNNTTSLNSMGYNYIIALESDSSEINSRWFILEEKQTRQGQWVMQLRRDLVSDFYYNFINSTVYVEKGRVTQGTTSIANLNPLLFNQEQFTANQIKKNETLLKDNTGCKWIVGYLNKGAYPEDILIQSHTNLATYTDTSVNTTSELNELLGKYQNNIVRYPKALEAVFNYGVRKNLLNSTLIAYYNVKVGESALDYLPISAMNINISGLNAPGAVNAFKDKYLDKNNYSDMLSYVITKYTTWAAGQAEWVRVLGLNNKTILVKETNKTYRCKVTKTPESSYNTGVSQNNDPTWYNNLTAYLKRNPDIKYTDGDDLFTLILSLSEGLSVELVEIKNEAYKANIPNSRNRTLNEAFDAFAIPYVDSPDSQLYVHVQGVILHKVTDPNGAMAIAQELVDVSSEALDLQLVPYCPLPESMISMYQGEGDTRAYPIITVEQSQANIEGSSIFTLGDQPDNAIFWLSTTTFSKIIEYTDTNDYGGVDNIKAINQLDMWRISSGDYSSSFEFNMARNGGVSYFEIDCAYKPYQPYIHVAPNFGGLYGQDYNDTRGLICSNTNYSLPRLTDAWESYERNNLNYMNSFNRQIQKIDTDRKYQRIGEIGSIIGGAGTGAASGAMIGTMIAPGIGTAIGVAAGGVMSAGAGAVDMYINEQLYKENKKYSIDQFNMSLENIRALPNTLAAVGALNPNNKVFPILEHYSCSDLEKEAFLNKLRWNGMSINVIGNPVDYIDTTRDCYFKGQIINIDIDGPAHEAGELAVEIAKGVIFERST